MDFTVEKYNTLCSAIVNSGYACLRIVDAIETQNLPENVIILRHDVDRKPHNALALAEIEYQHKIKSTYYFRMVPGSYKPEIIKKIDDLGHEIGFHYESLSKAKGNYQEAIRLFSEELNTIRKIVDIKTIAMHGSPISPYNNIDLWKTFDFTQFGIIGEAYLSIDYRNIAYFTDTGRTWEKNKHNLRDTVTQGEIVHNPVVTTDDLIRIVASNDLKKMCIQSHPERWAEGIFEWGVSYMTDQAVNFVKSVLKRIREK